MKVSSGLNLIKLTNKAAPKIKQHFVSISSHRISFLLKKNGRRRGLATLHLQEA
jgi:hypothetical protein